MIPFVLLTAVYTYLVTIGGTYNGILNPQLRLLNVLALGIGALLWLISRRRTRLRSTALDGAILVWIAAFALSLLANSEVWRRSAEALWYMGAYIGLWYILHDLIIRRALRRQSLLDALLIGGAVVVLFGYLQIGIALSSGLGLPRPASTLGNPNTLAAALVVLIPLVITRWMSMRGGLIRAALGIYTLLALLLLGLTFSRAGWLGGAAGLVFLALGLISRQRFSQWWAKQRTLTVITAAVGVLVVAAGGYLVFTSLTETGRGLDYRTFIYETAINLFVEKPLFGQGLFTFGRGLARFNSTPPIEPHSHAHSVPLNVAAELGLVGLLALALTVVLAGCAIWRNLQRSNGLERLTITGAAAGALAFGVHHLLDLPAMMPAIAVTGLLAVVGAVTPPPSPLPEFREGEKDPSQILPPRRANEARQGEGMRVRVFLKGGWGVRGIIALILILTLSGVYTSLVYSRYMGILNEAATTGDYRTAAIQMADITAADPYPIYEFQRGLLWGLAANDTPTEVLPQAIDAFERFTALEPDYAMGWANLGALYAQMGDSARGIAAMERAAEIAPRIWVFPANIAQFAADNPALERSAYAQAVNANPDIVLNWRGVQDEAIQAAVAGVEPASDIGRTLDLLARGEAEAARALWESSATYSGEAASVYVVSALVAAANGDAEAAAQSLQRARGYPDEAWLYAGEACLNSEVRQTALGAAQAALNLAPLEVDWSLGANILYIQFLRLGIPRQFLPQVGYLDVDPTLYYLLSQDGSLCAR